MQLASVNQIEAPDWFGGVGLVWQVRVTRLTEEEAEVHLSNMLEAAFAQPPEPDESDITDGDF